MTSLFSLSYRPPSPISLLDERALKEGRANLHLIFFGGDEWRLGKIDGVSSRGASGTNGRGNGKGSSKIIPLRSI